MKTLQLELWKEHNIFPHSLVLRMDGFAPIVLSNDYEKAEALFKSFKGTTEGHPNKAYDITVKPYDCDLLNEGEITQLVLQDEISRK